MMFIKFTMTVFVGLYPIIVSCQHVTEKIFFASDKVNYNLGDTISLFGQICPTDTLGKNNYSRYLYVELITQQDSVLLRNKLKSDEKGRFSAKLPVETYWKQGTYHLRAYTRLMQNFNPLSFPGYSIQIGKQKQDSMEKAKEVPSKGILYRPMGISNLGQPFIPVSKIRLPSSAGRYKLLVDCVSPQDVFSYEYPIEIIGL